MEVLVKIPTWLERPSVFVVLLYRRLRYGYPFRRIRLTQNKYAIVDPEDYNRLSKHKWYAAKGHHTFYAVRGKWSKIRERRFELRMHRVIMNAPAHLYVDHINHNGLDNRKANLRLATCEQSVCNRKKFARLSTSKYKGISWHSSTQKWCACIQTNNTKIHLGSFDSETEAAKTYDKAARQYHKEFASLNFESPHVVGGDPVQVLNAKRYTL